MAQFRFARLNGAPVVRRAMRNDAGRQAQMMPGLTSPNECRAIKPNKGNEGARCRRLIS
jgi:hypothetical protein